MKTIRNSKSISLDNAQEVIERTYEKCLIALAVKPRRKRKYERQFSISVDDIDKVKRQLDKELSFVVRYEALVKKVCVYRSDEFVKAYLDYYRRSEFVKIHGGQCELLIVRSLFDTITLYSTSYVPQSNHNTESLL